jgi:hypothetical protein
MSTYKWYPPFDKEGKPIIQPGAYRIKPRKPVPKVMPNELRIPYRIVKISEDGKTATVCANMKHIVDGKLSVSDVDITKLGLKSVVVGDILSYAVHDKNLTKPLITIRHHQSHQFPKQLLSADEV